MAQMPGTGSWSNAVWPDVRPSTQGKVSGKVAEVQQLIAAVRSSNAVWINCQDGLAYTLTSTRNLVVHFGPAAHLASKNLNIAKGDDLIIVGSKVKYRDSELVFAREITKGTQVLTLRDARGFPLWCGGRKQTPMRSA